MKYSKISWEADGIYHTLESRNVGEANPHATIQIAYERYDMHKERNKPLICINIPSHLTKNFITSITDDSYNGYPNFETWLFALNLDNDEALYNQRRLYAQQIILKNEKCEQQNSEMEIGDMAIQLIDKIKTWMDEEFWLNEYSIYKICDVWTDRDFKEIHLYTLCKDWIKEELESMEQD